MRWSYFKFDDLLHTYNVYKILGKEYHVLDFWVTHEISASEILFWEHLEYVPLMQRNYKELKRAKRLWSTIFSILKAQSILMTTVK